MLGAGLLAVGGVSLGLRGTTLRTPRTPLKVLSQAQFSVLAAIADRVSPATATLPSAWDLHVPEKVDALLAGKAAADLEEFALVLDLVENALVGLMLDRRISTFTGSSPAVQDAVLTAMMTSSFETRRTMFTALRGLCTASYWSDLRASKHIGYPGPPDFGNVGVSAPIVATPAALPELTP